MIVNLDYHRKLAAALTLATIVVLWVVFAAWVYVSPEELGGPELSKNPAIERHAEVVSFYNATH
jgi:hypothetical protein